MEQKYLTDASNYKGNPAKVLKPKTETELIDIIKSSYNNDFNSTFFGSGTGLTGGAATDSGILISTENLNNILKLNSNLVTVQAGVVYSDLNQYLSDKDLFYPPNPTETSSTIGGNVSTNASGSRTFRYGATRNWVESISVILPDGDKLVLKRGENIEKEDKLILKTESCKEFVLKIDNINMPDIKHAAGYYLKKGMDAIDLFIGSEGTLGFISEITLRVIPKPESILGLIIFFDNTSKLSDFVSEVREKSKVNFDFDQTVVGDVCARLIEYFDNRSLNVLRKKYSQIPAEAKAAIWIEQEYFSDNEPLIFESWSETIAKYTSLLDDVWTATNEKEHRFFAEFRHTLPQEVYENLSSNNSQKIGTDTAVKDEDFPEYFNWLNKSLESLDIPYLVFGHIGNSHLHANIFYQDEAQMKKAMKFYDDLIDKTIKLEGTVSAEHGIGKIKRKYLYKMFNKNSMGLMLDIKNKIDPKGLFGKGNLFL